MSGKKPLQIDLLVVEKRDGVSIRNEIGRIFRRHNIIEYKSPGDGMSIDDFFKAVGYACIYKCLGETVNQIPAEQLIVSLVREGKPVELIRTLEGYGLKLFGLVKDGILTISDAAKRANMKSADFEKAYKLFCYK